MRERVGAAIERLRTAWQAGVGAEAEARFPGLADHYAGRLNEGPLNR